VVQKTNKQKEALHTKSINCINARQTLMCMKNTPENLHEHAGLLSHSRMDPWLCAEWGAL